MSLLSNLSDFPWDFEEPGWDHGYAQTKPMSWWDFFKCFFSDKDQLSNYIYRGLAKKSYELESTFARECKKLSKTFTIWNSQEHLMSFRYAIRGRIKTSDSVLLSDEEIWAIGQHHGLATPLLDWTESLFVAAFFAFHEDQRDSREEPREEYRAIYALNTEVINTYYDFAVSRALPEEVYNYIEEQGQTHSDIGTTEHEIRLKVERIASGHFPAEPKIVGACRKGIEKSLVDAVKIVKPMSGENARLVNQRGLFTYFLQSDTLEEFVKKMYKDAVEHDLPMHQEELILAKFILRDAERPMALKHIAQMNINYSSLFPDLFGASKYCNALMRELRDH